MSPTSLSIIMQKSFPPTWKGVKSLGLAGLILLALILMSPSQGWTEGSEKIGSFIEDDLAFLKEEEVVVTAILQEQPISEAPSNMYVITEEDIRHSGATDIPTLFTSVPVPSVGSPSSLIDPLPPLGFYEFLRKTIQ